jgi:hypothetical protein
MPPGIYKRRPHAEIVAERIAGIRRKAVLTRWESVKAEQEKWIRPFQEQPIEVAMRYLEDLRTICERGGNIMNARINDNNSIKCSGPRCGHDLTGLKPNGMPKWIKKMDYKDKRHPEIFHSMYFCSELCANEFTRASMGASGTDGK